MDSLKADHDDDRRARVLQVEKKQRKKRRRRAERIASFVTPLLLAGALAAACVYGAEQTTRAEGLERNVGELYRQSFYELTENINDMQVSLKKIMVVSSARQHILLLNDVWRLASAAATNMASLPQSHVDTMAANQFVIRAGDYAHSLSTRILNGEVLSSKDSEQLRALYESSVSIARELESRLNNDDLPIASISTDEYYAEASTDAEGSEGAEGSSGSEGSKDQESIANYPTLIYDGPFSESTEKAGPRGLSGSEVSVEEAVSAGVRFLGGGQLTSAGEVAGTMPTYTLTGTDAEGREVELAVTKQGGLVLWMMSQAQGGGDGAPDEESTAAYAEAASAFLKERGYEAMTPTYAQYYAGTAVLNYAATQDNVILYSDLIKVYVERESKKVIGMDANNFLFSHVQRKLTAPAISEADARSAVSDALAVASTKLALIPKTANTEVLCYEFKGQCSGADFIVYINANTGAEEEVYEIINSDEGQLVV